MAISPTVPALSHRSSGCLSLAVAGVNTPSAGPCNDALIWSRSGSHRGMGDPKRPTSIAETDTAGLIDHCQRNGIDLVVVGPEAPLAAGAGDSLRAEGIPSSAPAPTAPMEASKTWGQLMREAAVPTAGHWSVTSETEALSVLEKIAAPCGQSRWAGRRQGRHRRRQHRGRRGSDRRLRRTVRQRRNATRSRRTPSRPGSVARPLRRPAHGAPATSPGPQTARG